MTRLGSKAVQDDYLHAGKRLGSAVRIDGGGAGFFFLFGILWTRWPRKNYAGTL